MIRKIIVLILTGFLPVLVSGQSAPTDTLSADSPFYAAVHVQACYRGDSIVLRWSPGTPGAWREVNKTGYIISRAVLEEDGSFDPATFLSLQADPVKPWPLERWASVAGQNSNDNFAKVAAQALYGKSFVPVNGFVGQADEFATRFSFAMLAADISPATARALGLRYADRSIQKGKSYIYRIHSPVDTTRYRVDAGVVVVHTREPQPVPQAVIDHVKERENMIEVYWSRDIHDPHFSAYHIERSDDNGRSFARLTKTPYVHAVSERSPVTAEYFVYVDSVKANYKNYRYRIIGITPFGELASPSSAVSAMGRDRTPPPQPLNVKAQHVGGSRVKISWEYPKQTKELRGFLIGRGHNPTKQFEPLTTEPLSAKTREFIDNRVDVMASNYYIVAAVDTAGNASLSLAQYAMIIDSIPPAPPKGLTGTIDSTGVVTISWKLGPEPDIQGYLVFIANQPDHEFAQKTNGPLADTVFRDTITLKTLTKKIYYRVVALDYNSNYSKFSEILELKRPDIVPPSAAVMDRYKITEKGIELHWVPSSSEDLAKTVLYRSEGGKVWKEVAIFPPSDLKNSYLDTAHLQVGKVYSYSLISVDEDGLQSKRSVPIRLKAPDFKARQPVDQIDATALPEEKSILVTWNYPVKGDYRFVLYRAVNGSAFQSYKSLSNSSTTFKDKEIKKGSSYEYSLGVVFKDGKKSPYGKIVKTSYN